MTGGGERKAYPLRIDPALWAAVERCAAAELRSVNAQIECLLREALSAPRSQTQCAQPAQARPPSRGSESMSDDGPEWFALKRYGYGSGFPISWQGWAVTLGFMAIAFARRFFSRRGR